MSPRISLSPRSRLRPLDSSSYIPQTLKRRFRHPRRHPAHWRNLRSLLRGANVKCCKCSRLDWVTRRLLRGWRSPSTPSSFTSLRSSGSWAREAARKRCPWASGVGWFCCDRGYECSKTTFSNPTCRQTSLLNYEAKEKELRTGFLITVLHLEVRIVRSLSLGHGRVRSDPLRPPLVPQPGRSARRAERLSSVGCCIGAPNTSAAVRPRERSGARKHQTPWAC